MAKINQAARDKIVSARTTLLVSNGFFGFLALQMRLVEATEVGGHPIDTMAVDGKNLYYNPDWTLKLSSRECEGVVCHEVMHCALSHFDRRQNRDPMIWNIAGDFVINGDLRDSGFILPGTPLPFDQLVNPKSQSQKGIYLYDPKLKGMSTEAIYDKLME